MSDSRSALLAKEEKFEATQRNNTNFNQIVGNSVVDANSNKYKINLKSFPGDIQSDPSLLHYINFAINVRGKSKYNRGDRLYRVDKDPNGAGLTSDELSSSFDNILVLGGAAAGAVAGAKAGQNIDRIIPGRTPGTAAGQAGRAAAGSVIKGLAGGLGALGGAALGSLVADITNSSDTLSPDNTYRISDSITLHLQERPSVKYSAQYANKDLGTLAGILGVTGGNSLSESLNNATNMSGEIASAALLGLAKLPSIFGGTDVKSILSARAGVNLNPFREVLFEAIDFRSFSFNHRFMPKSNAETQMVQSIIKLFKFHMHPELSTNRLFFIYPAEFQITYFFKNQENKYFHKFTPCVLTDMQVSYGGEQFSSFKDGAPNEINLALTFRETEILTKEKIIQGY